MSGKALETGVSHHMFPVGDPIGGLFYRGLGETDVGVLSERSVSLSLSLSLCLSLWVRGNLKQGLLYWGP